MNKIAQSWMFPVCGSLLCALAARGQGQSPALEKPYLDSTNRLTASLRFGLNITGRFQGTGASLNPNAPAAAGRYVDGYVLPDSGSGSGDPYTWYWGYDQASQVNASGANSLDFHNYTAAGFPRDNAADDCPYIGCEVTYDYLLGIKEDWHHLRYGVEGAVNFMPIDFNSGGVYNGPVTQVTDTYGYTPGTTPPAAGYRGSYSGAGFVLHVPRSGTATTVIPGATFEAHQQFDANLWGFRLGPYIELPVSEKLYLHGTGGFAAGLLDASANWKETLLVPGNGRFTSGGGGDDVDVLYGFYIGLDAVYQFNERWSVDVGAQYQDLGTYRHAFGGRTAELDLSQSIFIQAGLSYSF